MANPFVKGWKYLMALFGAKIDEHADPKVQIQQAIEEAQRQHQVLVQQAAAVIGNQRQLEMKLSRQMTEVDSTGSSAIGTSTPGICSASATVSLTSRSSSERRAPSASQIAASSSLEGSFWPRSISER